MIKQTLIATAISALLVTPAFASGCPVMVKDIDAALAAGPSLSAAQIAEVKSLRDKGDALHGSGDHKDSVKTLQQAKEILGLE